MKYTFTLLLAGTLCLTPVAMANEMADHDQMDEPMMGAQVMTKGVVTKVDKATGKVGIRHEAIANLGMPAMTMIFKAADPALLEGLKAGDPIEFFAEQQGGQLVITSVHR